jgi:hypothetical protein
LACVERLMGDSEKTSEQLQTHRWQAVVSVMLGFGGWLLAVLALPLATARNFGVPSEGVAALCILAGVSVLPALFGIGLAAAAIRIRGDRMMLATCGLLLTAAQVGTVMGLVLLVIWKQ